MKRLKNYQKNWRQKVVTSVLNTFINSVDMEPFLIRFCSWITEYDETLQYAYNAISTGNGIEDLMEDISEKYPEVWLKSFKQQQSEEDLEGCIAEAGATWRSYLGLD